MTSVKLATYDPKWQSKWESHYENALLLWQRAVDEMRAEGAIRQETKDAWIASIHGRQKVRKRQFETTADVARRIFNIVAGRAALMGENFDPKKAPEPESFESLRSIREFFKAEMDRIKSAVRAKKPSIAYSLPVLQEHDGTYFTARGTKLSTQAVHIPDLDGGFAMIVISEKVGDQRYVCLSGRAAPSRFRAKLPEIATVLSQRMFGEDDPQNIHFFVHHPIGFGPNGHEQFWRYDVRADLSGIFHMAGRNMHFTLPHAVAYKRFDDGKPESETMARVLAPGLDSADPEASIDGFIEAQEKAALKPRKPVFN